MSHQRQWKPQEGQNTEMPFSLARGIADREVVSRFDKSEDILAIFHVKTNYTIKVE